jgi:hypothetical protein
VHGQEDRGAGEAPFEGPAPGFDAVHLRHRDVGDYQIRTKRVRGCQQLQATAHRADDIELGSKQFADLLADIGVVVRQHNAESRSRLRVCGRGGHGVIG